MTALIAFLPVVCVAAAAYWIRAIVTRSDDGMGIANAGVALGLAAFTGAAVLV